MSDSGCTVSKFFGLRACALARTSGTQAGTAVKAIIQQ
jgi:hypothetical protein